MSWPTFAPDEIEAAARVLSSGRVNYWTGDEGKSFEREFAEFHGVDHAIALANGTVALELALIGLGIDSGEVVVPSRTYVATASAVCTRGATPRFADVDPASGNVSVATIEACMSRGTRAVIVVHIGGLPCEMDPIVQLCRERGVSLIEDCAQAHGARYRGQRVGTLGDVGCFSFCQDKILTTAGEGGMLITPSEEVYRRAWSYKDHGKDLDRVYRRDHPPGFRWLHATIGTNWRLSEVQSAVGRAQLEKLDAFLLHRRRMAELYAKRLSAAASLRTPAVPDDIEHAYYRFYTYLRPEALGPEWSRDRIVGELNARGVSCSSGTCSEIYLEDAFSPELRPKAPRMHARTLGASSLAFLVDPSIDEPRIHRDCDVLLQILEEARPRS